MKFMLPLIAVSDMATSRRFYEEILKQKVTLDLGDNVTFEDKFALQANYAHLVDKAIQISQKANDHELYFEEEDFPKFMTHLKNCHDVQYVHGPKEYPWGQHVVRFYDPDFHIIEVGESMPSVFKRFLQQGLTIADVAKRTMHPVEYIEQFLDCVAKTE